MALVHGLLSCQTPAGGGVAADALVYGYTQHSAPLSVPELHPSTEETEPPALLPPCAQCRDIGEKGVG